MAWKLRIEWVLADGPVQGLAVVIAAQTLTGTGSTVIAATAAPVFRKQPRGIARITMLSGAALVAIDDTTPTESDSVRLATGADPYEFSLATGQILYFAESADASSSAGASAPDVSLGFGTTDAKTQRVVLASDGPAVTALGNISDTSATTDAGAFSIIALLKRGLGYWSTLQAKLPAQIGGRIPTDILGALVANQVAVSATTAAAFALNANTKRVSLQAALYNVRFAFGVSSAAALTAVAATSTSLRVLAGAERDFSVPTGATHIAYMREASATNDVEMAELT